MNPADNTEQLSEAVSQIARDSGKILITGGNSKSFYGNTEAHLYPVTELSTLAHTGIISYEPSELFLTARAGTRLSDIRQLLAENQQMLPFESPTFDGDATIGGVVATGLSGPRRPYAGSVRDAILGCKIINGMGEVLKFGGQVMKNVAGYDVTRLNVGAMGTLGLLVEISIKVMPIPELEQTIVQPLMAHKAIALMNQYAGQSLPISGASYDGELMHIRLSGAETALRSVRKKISGDLLENNNYWPYVNEQSHAFFKEVIDGDIALWRLSLAPATATIDIDGQCLLDWGGAVRWLKSTSSAKDIRNAVSTFGGHATLFRGKSTYNNKHQNESLDVFHPLTKPLSRIHKNLKLAFDPKGLFNPGRFHANID